jgi:hypothetical protein
VEEQLEEAMLNIRAGKFLAGIVVALAMLIGASTQSRAQSGTVHLHITKAGFIVGVGGGSGTLTYHHRTYGLTVGGVGIGSLGVASAELVGRAYHLRRPSDIAGTYGAAGAGVTFVGGAQVVQLKNEKGVVLELRGKQVGFQASLGLAGMTISLR